MGRQLGRYTREIGTSVDTARLIGSRSMTKLSTFDIVLKYRLLLVPHDTLGHLPGVGKLGSIGPI
jgi:hypothetical protein